MIIRIQRRSGTQNGIIVVRNEVDPSEVQVEGGSEKIEKKFEVIDVEELRRRLTGRDLLQNIAAYDDAYMIVDSHQHVSQPLKSLIALWALSPERQAFIEPDGTVIKASLTCLARSAKQYALDALRKRCIINRHRDEIKKMNEEVRSRKTSSIDFSRPPLYLRTNLWSGIKGGGSVAHTAGVLNNMASYGAEPIFCTSVSVPTIDEEIEQYILEKPKKYLDFPAARHLYFSEECAERLSDSFAGEEIGFIYQRASKYNYTGTELAGKFQVPLVIEYNGSVVWISENWGKGLRYPHLAEEIELLNLRAADLVIVVSEPMAKNLTDRGVDRKKILVNPNGVDIDAYTPDINGTDVRERYSLAEKTVIGFIGTFEKWHGAEVLADAFGKIINESPYLAEDIALLLIGNGTTMDEVEKIIEKHDVEEKTVHTGMVPQAEGPKYLASCDILVSPHVPNSDGTEFFGSPTKLFEYMAMGKPIVASDLQQIGRILEHEHTALLAEPGNANELAERLHRLITSPDLRSQLGTAAREKVVAEYTWKAHTERIYRELSGIRGAQFHEKSV